jgi:hypothetical protein
MKILFVAVFTPNSTNVSQSRGFKDNGAVVYEYDYRERLSKLRNLQKRDDELIELAKSWLPDLVVFSKCNNMHYRVVDEINKVSKTCMWYMDAMHNFDLELIEKTKRVNYFVSGVEGVTEHAHKLCKETTFVHQCPDELMNFIDNDERHYEYDITFIGSVDSSKIHGNRKTFVDALKTNFNGFKHFNGVFGLEHNEIVNKSKINLNFSPTDATGVSVRIYKILASGGFLMSTPWKNMENTFTPGEDIVIFNNKEELIDKINYYLKHDSERENIRNNGNKLGQQFLPKEWAKKIIQFCK